MNAPNPISSRDSLMAAKARNMTFVTRKTVDVERSGTRIPNPSES